MSKKVYALIVGVSGGICAIAGAIVSFIQPNCTPAIVGSIGIVGTAIAEICSLFLKKEE